MSFHSKRPGYHIRNEVEDSVQNGPVEPVPEAHQCPVQTLPQCSDCDTLGHKRTHCPNHIHNWFLYRNAVSGV